MNPFQISLIALVSMLAGMSLGILCRRFLPNDHLNSESRDVMKLGVGMLATLSAMVLGLLISSAKNTFDTINRGTLQIGSKIILLDKTLVSYGPETKDARDFLRNVVQSTIDEIWLKNRTPARVDRSEQERRMQVLGEKLAILSPVDDRQRMLQSRAVSILNEIAELRLFLTGHIGHSSFPMPLMVLLICWLSLIFFCFCLLSSPNPTLSMVLLVCVFSATSALFLLLELDQPFGGLIKVSGSALQEALMQIR